MNKNQISSLIRAIYNGKINPLKLPKKLYSEIANHLTEGVYKGYGGGLSAFDFDTPDYRMVANLRENVYIFSGAKTFNYVLSTEGLIVEGNEILPFKEFKKRALTVYEQYNDTWLKTEYETAIGQAQNARAWQDIEVVKESFPLVKYQTSNDANVSIICRPLDGVILPVGDPFWATHSPKNHYNCFVPETKIKTALGWKRIDSIKKGDLVYGGSGNLRHVEGVHINEADGDICRLVIKNHSTLSTKNHRFLTIQGWKRAENIKSFNIIIDNVQIGIFNKAVCCVNNCMSILGYFFMPIITKWKSRAINAFNNYVKLWDENINILTSNRLIANTQKPLVCKEVNNCLFVLSRLSMILSMPVRFAYVCLNSFIVRPLSNFKVKHWVGGIHSYYTIWSGFAKHWMWNCFSNLVQYSTGFRPSFGVVNPLRFDGLATIPGGKPVLSKELQDRSISNTPTITNFSKSKHFGKVKSDEGFPDGTTFEGFNSVYGFLIHAFFNRRFSLVISNTNIQYKGLVFNLSVEKDESYITPVGVAHNCRCYLQSVRDVAEVKPPKGILEPQEGFKMNPGMSGEVFDKSHPYFDIPLKYRKFAKNNYGLSIDNHTDI
jgi:hypothetical protein